MLRVRTVKSPLTPLYERGEQKRVRRGSGARIHLVGLCERWDDRFCIGVAVMHVLKPPFEKGGSGGI